MSVERRSIDFDGRTRSWIEVGAPAGGAAGGEVGGHSDTLVLFLHGSRQSANVARSFTATTFDRLARDGAVVVYPDGVGRHFNDLRRGFQETARTEGVDDVGFLSRLIELYAPQRVIGCGFSNGGQMLIRMLFDAPGTLSGVALFGAPLPAPGNSIVNMENWAPTPIVCVQGTADPIVPFGGGEAGLSGANRGEVRSAADTAAYFAQRNGAEWSSRFLHAPGVIVDRFTGPAPVQLWTLEGVGHLVPSPKKLDPRIGPGTDAVTGAGIVERFFGV